MLLADKFNEVMGKGVYSGTFVAPEKFDKYFCLNNLYFERGAISDSLKEVQPNLSIRDLARYCNQRLSGIRMYDGYVSRQDNLGACGTRNIHITSKGILMPPEREHIIKKHLGVAKKDSKPIVIFCYDQFWSNSREYVQDIKYADEMPESVEFCKNWLLMQKHSKCWCHIFVYGYDTGMYLLPYYKDSQALCTDEMIVDVMTKLYRYNYFIKMPQMRLE